MVGGYLHPGKPMANMYFVLYSSSVSRDSCFANWYAKANSQILQVRLNSYYGTSRLPNVGVRITPAQSYNWITDSKLPPQAAFTAQLIGTIFGAFLNYGEWWPVPYLIWRVTIVVLVLMNSIVTNQREILLSVQGTNVWSGEQAQIYNSQAITWGGLSNQLFSAGKKYQWVSYAYIIGLLAPLPFWIIHRYWPKLRANFISTPFISVYVQNIFWSIAWSCDSGILSLARGDISSVFFSYFIVGFYSQWYMRTRHPRWFQRYNYIVGAGELHSILVNTSHLHYQNSSRWWSASDGVHTHIRCLWSCWQFSPVSGVVGC